MPCKTIYHHKEEAMRTIYFIILLNWFWISTVNGQKAYLYETKIPVCCDYECHALELKDGSVIYTLMERYSNIDNYVRSVKVIKLSKEGEIIWTSGYKDLYHYYNDMTPFFENNNGDIFFYGDGGLNGYLQLLKMNSSGEVLWIKSYLKNFVHGEFSSGIGDSDGNLILTGSVSYDTKTKGMVAAISQDGEVLWVRMTKNADMVMPEEMFILRVIENKKGNLVVFGHGYSGSKKKRFLCLSELDKSGKTIWTNAYFRSIIAASSTVNNLCETDSGYTIVGSLGPSSNGALMMAVNAEGKMLWNKNYMISKLFWFTNVFWHKEDVHDYFVFCQDYYNLYLLRMDAAGEIKKSRLMSNGGNSIVSDYLLPTQDGGYISAYSQVKFQNGEADGSILLMKLNQQLEFACKSEEVDLSKIEIKSLDLYDDEEEYSFEGTSCKVEDWTDYELINADIQFEIICETTATTDVSAEAGALRLYPNPVSSTLSIDVEQVGYGTVRDQAVDITDLLGRRLYTVDIDYDGHAEIDTQALPPGMYIAVLRTDGHQVQAVKFVVVRSEK